MRKIVLSFFLLSLLLPVSIRAQQHQILMRDNSRRITTRSQATLSQDGRLEVPEAEIGQLHFKAAVELTISAGAVTQAQTYHTIDTESDAATDDLDTITPAAFVADGSRIILRGAVPGTRVVTLKDGTGNLNLGKDIALSAGSLVELVWNTTSSQWDLSAGGIEGAGGVVGPGSSTDNAVVRFDGTAGDTLQDSKVTVDDLGNLTLGDNSQATVELIFDDADLDGPTKHTVDSTRWTLKNQFGVNVLDSRVDRNTGNTQTFFIAPDEDLSAVVGGRTHTFGVGQETNNMRFAFEINKTLPAPWNYAVTDGSQDNRFVDLQRTRLLEVNALHATSNGQQTPNHGIAAASLGAALLMGGGSQGAIKFDSDGFGNATVDPDDIITQSNMIQFGQGNVDLFVQPSHFGYFKDDADANLFGGGSFGTNLGAHYPNNVFPFWTFNGGGVNTWGPVAINADPFRLTLGEPSIVVAYNWDMLSGSEEFPIRWGTEPTSIQFVAVEGNGTSVGPHFRWDLREDGGGASVEGMRLTTRDESGNIRGDLRVSQISSVSNLTLSPVNGGVTIKAPATRTTVIEGDGAVKMVVGQGGDVEMRASVSSNVITNDLGKDDKPFGEVKIFDGVTWTNDVDQTIRMEAFDSEPTDTTKEGLRWMMSDVPGSVSVEAMRLTTFDDAGTVRGNLDISQLSHASTNIVTVNDSFRVSEFSGHDENDVTLGAGATSFAATGTFVALTGDAGGNTISSITGGQVGDRLTIAFDALGGGITFTDTAAPAADQLALTADFVAGGVNDTLELIRHAGYWKELSRSLNSGGS